MQPRGWELLGLGGAKHRQMVVYMLANVGKNIPTKPNIKRRRAGVPFRLMDSARRGNAKNQSQFQRRNFDLKMVLQIAS